MKVRMQDNMEEILRSANKQIAVTGERDFSVLEGNNDDLPMFINTFNNKMFGTIPILYMCPPLPTEICLSQISLTFSLSYYLGMLCRYFPSHWIALSRGNRGDEVWPLMRACISYIEESYPQLVMEAIQKKTEK